VRLRSVCGVYDARMFRYAIRRVFAAIPTLLILIALAFFMIRAAPAPTPASSATSMAHAPSCSDTGNPPRISSVQLRPIYRNERTQSPCASPQR